MIENGRKRQVRQLRFEMLDDEPLHLKFWPLNLIIKTWKNMKITWFHLNDTTFHYPTWFFLPTIWKKIWCKVSSSSFSNQNYLTRYFSQRESILANRDWLSISSSTGLACGILFRHSAAASLVPWPPRLCCKEWGLETRVPQFSLPHWHGLLKVLNNLPKADNLRKTKCWNTLLCITLIKTLEKWNIYLE